MKQAAKKAGLPFDYKELKDKQAIELSHEVLMDLSGDADENYKQKIGSETYDVIKADNTPYFGALQNDTKIFILSDKTFESLKNLGSITYFYNYRIENMKNMEASRAYLNTLAHRRKAGQLDKSHVFPLYLYVCNPCIGSRKYYLFENRQ